MRASVAIVTVSDTPLVWQCVRSSRDFWDLASNFSFIRRAHTCRAARNFAISM